MRTFFGIIIPEKCATEKKSQLSLEWLEPISMGFSSFAFWFWRFTWPELIFWGAETVGGGDWKGHHITARSFFHCCFPSSFANAFGDFILIYATNVECQFSLKTRLLFSSSWEHSITIWVILNNNYYQCWMPQCTSLSQLNGHQGNGSRRDSQPASQQNDKRTLIIPFFLLFLRLKLNVRLCASSQ